MSDNLLEIIFTKPKSNFRKLTYTMKLTYKLYIHTILVKWPPQSTVL